MGAKGCIFGPLQDSIEERRHEVRYMTAWEAHTGSIRGWLKNLLANGEITPDDIVWQGPDGSYGVGSPTLEDEESFEDLEMVEAGKVSEWIQ